MTYGSIDLRITPYRGILSEIARELGISRQAVQRAIRTSSNQKIISLLEDKIKERENAFRRNQRILKRLK